MTRVQASDTSFTPTPKADLDVKVVKKELPKPDFSQMKPFKPTAAMTTKCKYAIFDTTL